MWNVEVKNIHNDQNLMDYYISNVQFYQKTYKITNG